ncbi:hypothetical protein [Rhodopirellula bahusiensis]|uniref:hypothetical protein n=1 Tax=Rhodopirellula bahusiensis TaxID=2014065 RepID=UPI003263D268
MIQGYKSRTVYGLLCFTAFASFWASTATAALVLNANYIDTAAGTWDATTTGVVNQAMADWQSKILGIHDGMGGVASVTVDFDVVFTTGSSYLGQWQGAFSASSGADVRPWTDSGGSYSMTHEIRFNADLMGPMLANELWFDPTPMDDGLDKAFEDWDALTVARHEIGHMLGFTGLYRDDIGIGSESFPWGDLIDPSDQFDPSGLNISMEPGDAGHLLDDALLMDTVLSNAEGRIEISNTELQMLELGYGYALSATAVPEPGCLFVLSSAGLGVALRKKRRVLNS